MITFWYVLVTHWYVLVCTIIHFLFQYLYVPVRTCTYLYVPVRTGHTKKPVLVQLFTIPDVRGTWSWPEQLLSAPEDSKRQEACTPSGVMGCDPATESLANVH